MSSYTPQRPSRAAFARYATGSSNDTAYNGSEGHIDDFPTSMRAPSPMTDAQATRSSTSTPQRPAMGARFMSAVQNAQPAAAALTRKGSVLHSRAKSLAAFVPKLNTTTTATTASTSTPDKVQQPSQATPAAASNRLFGDFFAGESAPIRLGAPVSPTKEKTLDDLEAEFVMEYTPMFTERPRAAGRHSTAASTPPAQAAAARQATSWFSRKASQQITPTSTPKRQADDELANLNVNTALFPNGASSADPLNPQAFNDLLLNATDLLQRMQAAYKEKSDFIATMQPELDVQREEVEEPETRSRHLKMQLEDMGRKAQEQERMMYAMAHELAEAKMQAQEAKTVRLVRDEGTPTRRKKRSSAGSASASDSGFESDLDSVFSANGCQGGAEMPAYAALSAQTQRRVPTGKRAPSQNLSTSAGLEVESLRSENAALREQVLEMEKGLQGALDLVSVMGLDG